MLPTPSPTNAPTVSPSRSPSSGPTPSPSKAPSSGPTTSPSQAPTSKCEGYVASCSDEYSTICKQYCASSAFTVDNKPAIKSVYKPDEDINDNEWRFEVSIKDILIAISVNINVITFCIFLATICGSKEKK